ncbi:hypothetical protein JDW15_10130 [Aerococcaceae bacterium zg-ZJ1578]|uniref:hypothetical protein n=1 Tax=Aerococcaceae bacterium zg-252 TaxID=2796928 RepID=UPI001A337ED8|nr:hypothetical protein [Aerococcaceae bacterium zg-1578]MBR7928487.1 hypothetical protein [Aerococcaceae bacterium zg-ZUI334]
MNLDSNNGKISLRMTKDPAILVKEMELMNEINRIIDMIDNMDDLNRYSQLIQQLNNDFISNKIN